MRNINLPVVVLPGGLKLIDLVPEQLLNCFGYYEEVFEKGIA
ncbi:hypothetical protein [Halocella sp. SP3-1]|nr:hypothetical protein [Halocella sp. SP3-1]